MISFEVGRIVDEAYPELRQIQKHIRELRAMPAIDVAKNAAAAKPRVTLRVIEGGKHE